MDKQVSANVSLALDYLSVAARAVWSVSWSRHLASLVRFCTLPLRFVWLPLSYFYSLFLVLIAPGVYIISYMLAWASTIVGFIYALELGAAAAIGTVSGILLALTSTFITNMLGMHQDPRAARRLAQAQQHEVKLKQALPSLSSAAEAEWYWTESSGKYRRPKGLLSQTILEEDDSDL